jgi:hypothetical protein
MFNLFESIIKKRLTSRFFYKLFFWNIDNKINFGEN